MRYAIAYDLGTGGIKTSIFDENGNSCGFKFHSYETRFFAEGFREQRPDDWWDAVKTTTKELLRETEISPDKIVSVAVSGHSLGAIPIGYDGELLCEYVPIWNDSRAKKQAEDFFGKTSEEKWYLSTGNGFPPELYSIFKMLWYKENVPDIYKNTDKFIGTKDYINYKLTGVLATDKSYASGCGVYSLKESRYDEEYVRISGVDRDKLPEILNSTDVVGTIIPEIAKEIGLSSKTLVCAGGVDNACMALGSGCIADGDVYTSLGTSAWIVVCDKKPVVDFNNRPYVFEHCVPGKYVSAVAIFSAGNSLKWVRDNIFFDLYSAELAGGISAYKTIDGLAELSPAGANKLFFIPTLAGGSSLDKNINAKGGFFGLDLMHTRSDIARAVLEGIALNLRVALDVFKKYVAVEKEMLIVGGGVKSDYWCQLFADIYSMSIITSRIGQDAGSFGAVAIAFVGSGVWSSFENIKKIVMSEKIITPIQKNVGFYDAIVPIYKELLNNSSDVAGIMKSYDERI